MAQPRYRSWFRCYRCWSQNLEVQVHYEGIHRIDPETGERGEVVDEMQEAVVQCLDCMHDQPHLGFHDGRVEPVEDRWERMIAGTPWVASCTVTVDAEDVETCSGPEAGDALSYASFGDHGTREFFTHVRFHQHDDDRIVVHLPVQLYSALGRGGDRGPRGGRLRPAGDLLARRGVAPAGIDGRRPALASARSDRFGQPALAKRARVLERSWAPPGARCQTSDTISATATGTVAGSSLRTKNSRSNAPASTSVSSATGHWRPALSRQHGPQQRRRRTGRRSPSLIVPEELGLELRQPRARASGRRARVRAPGAGQRHEPDCRRPPSR